MALHKIRDFEPNYLDYFDGQNILSFDLYSRDEKVGSVDDMLVDEEGHIRYLVINTGVWIFGKKVLLPIGQARILYSDRRVYADSLMREQVEALPEYNEDAVLDRSYEDQVQRGYRPAGSMGMSDRAGVSSVGETAPTSSSDRYDYDRDSELYGLNESDHTNLKLYEERLISNKTRRKVGEVEIGKRVEIETTRVSIPLEKEQVVVERVDPMTTTATASTDSTAFQEGIVARIEVYEEVPDVRKETVVREQVNIRKEVEQETATVREEVRREELEVYPEGKPAQSRDHDSLV
jgi:uncharacterized protein (TIGR02271 family)